MDFHTKEEASSQESCIIIAFAEGVENIIYILASFEGDASFNSEIKTIKRKWFLLKEEIKLRLTRSFRATCSLKSRSAKNLNYSHMKMLNGPQGPGDDFYQIIDIIYEDFGSSNISNENRNHNSLNFKKEGMLVTKCSRSTVFKKQEKVEEVTMKMS